MDPPRAPCLCLPIILITVGINELEKEQPQMDALGNCGFGMGNLVVLEENITFRSEIPVLGVEVWPLQ